MNEALHPFTGGGETRAVYVISVAAELAGMHPQTLRLYERKGLIEPARTIGNSRRYSAHDVARLRQIQALTNEGVGIEGVRRILDLEAAMETMRAAMQELQGALEATRAEVAATAARVHREYRRDLVPVRQAVVPVRRNPPPKSTEYRDRP
ncbi:MAG: heat shock protein transcriptional repressor HspR [Acidimicrobiia bacterium]